MGVIAAGVHHIREELFLIAAQTIADSVKDEDIQKGSLYPPLNIIKECSIQIALKICQYAYEQGISSRLCLWLLLIFILSGIASVYPEPKDKLKHVESQMYNFNYESSLPVTWAWPEPPKMKTRELIPTKLAA